MFFMLIQKTTWSMAPPSGDNMELHANHYLNVNILSFRVIKPLKRSEPKQVRFQSQEADIFPNSFFILSFTKISVLMVVKSINHQTRLKDLDKRLDVFLLSELFTDTPMKSVIFLNTMCTT